MIIIIDNNGEIMSFCDQLMADKQIRKGWALRTDNPHVLQALVTCDFKLQKVSA